MIYKMIPAETIETILESNSMKIRVEKLEDVIFIKVPHHITVKELQELDFKFAKVFGDRKYIILSDSVNFVKLEEVK